MVELLHPGVYVREISSGVRPIEGVSTSTAAFIGITTKGPLPGKTLPNGRMARPVLVTSVTDYLRQFGGFRADSYLTYAVQAFFNNGGARVYIVRVAGEGASRARYPTSPPTGAIIVNTVIEAATEGRWGSALSVEIADSSDRSPDNFKLIVRDAGIPVETYDNVTYDGSPTLGAGATPGEHAVTVVNGRSDYIAFSSPIAAAPPRGTVALGGGDDGVAVTDRATYLGNAAPDDTVTGTGLYALDKVTDVSIIAIPGQGEPETVAAGAAYCKNYRTLRDCFFIGDMGVLDIASARKETATPSVNLVSQARDYATTNPALDKSVGDFGAIYFPWIWSADPIGGGRNPRILLPPSGFTAGIYARTDNSRGVFKAPAGTEAGIAGALATRITVGDREQDVLNPVKVNVARTVPGTGIVVWGTRTYGSDAEWRYIPVRRMAIFLRTSIYYGIQWAVFEGNDEPLWSSLRLNIRAFMLTQFRAGAFQGATPDDAFFVKCDSSTTTQQDIDNGVVNILVGFAPLKPAEFVVLTLQQKVNQPAA
jgi:phage tail sheath protein FI